MKNKLLAILAMVSLFIVGVSASLYNDNVVTAKVNAEPMLISAYVYKQTIQDNDNILRIGIVPSGTKIEESQTSKLQRELLLAKKTIDWAKDGRAWDLETNKFVKFSIFDYHQIPKMNDIVIENGKVVIKGYDGPWAKTTYNVE
jgi:hypothetical protein